MSLQSIWLWVCWFFILIPVSVDNFWNLPVGNYDVRINYIGAAALLLTILFLNKNWTIEYFLRERQKVLPFLIMGLVGLVGTYFSSYHTRSIYMLGWSIGTIVLVPFVVSFLFNRDHISKHWLIRSFVFYLMLQSLIILLDFCLCIPSDGNFHIGRIMLYTHSGRGGFLCRPHAWYQEPGYFAAFAALSSVVVRAWIRFEKAPVWKAVSAGCWGLCLLAVVATTSRMGWLAVFFLVFLEIGRPSRLKISIKNFLLKISAMRPHRRFGFFLVIGVVLASISYVTISRFHTFYHYLGPAKKQKAHFPSLKYRMERVSVPFRVFKENLFVGAGPGAAGAYLVDRIPEDPWLISRESGHQNSLRNDPLSTNLYTELLSEWGLLGSFAFFLGLFGYLRGLRREFAIRAGVTLGIIYLTTQTLPRFDLWLSLALIMQIGKRVE